MRPRSQLKARHLFSVFLALVIFTCLALDQVSGFDDGTGDADDTCVGCHADGGNAIISMSLDSDTYEAEESGIVVTVTVNMDIGDSDAMMPGVMILTGSEENIKDAGWEIFRDPNDNAKPVNYNEKIEVSGDTEFTWTLQAPDVVGEHTLMARLIYDDGGAKFIETDTTILNITESTGGDSPTEIGDPTAKALSLGIIVGIVSVMIIMILRQK